MRNDGIVVLTGIIVLVTSTFFLKLQTNYKPSFQPRRGAFSIWWIIFCMLLISGVALFNTTNSQMIPSIFLFISTLGCAAWTQLANSDKAFYALLVACVFSILSVLTFSHHASLTPIVIKSGPSLLSGWLTIALALATTIHLKEYHNIDEKKWFPIPFIILNLTTSILAKAPLVSAPLLWSALFSQSKEMVLTFGSTGIFGITISALLLYFDLN